MDERTLQLVEALAAKLGTTAEYLWGVLLSQAPIHGVVTLLLAIGSILLATLLTVAAVVYSKRRDEDGCRVMSEGLVMLSTMGLLLLWLFVLSFVATQTQGGIIALLNPEYWALMQVLK